MDQKMLRDEQWERIARLLLDKASDPSRTAKVWIVRGDADMVRSAGRTGGSCASRAWLQTEGWERVTHALRGDADMEHLFIDSTVVRAHQHSAGAQKKRVAR